MTYREAEQYLTAPAVSVIRPGLARIRALLKALGDPQKRLRVIHIAGTNGKGSTAEMIRCMLTAAGYRTGSFSSPAVTGLRSTMALDGQLIPARTVAALTERIRDAQASWPEPATAFERQTALALLWFARCRADLCVIECGMGGEQDATNVFDRPVCGVITPIAPDHTDFLGHTLGEIAAQKAGILKAPGGVVVAAGQDEEALAALYEAVAARGLTVQMPAPARRDPDGSFVYAGQRYTCGLLGRMQADNACTALQVIEVLEAAGYAVPYEARQAGLAAVRMPCRQELLRTEPPLLLDGAHNPHNMAALTDTLASLGRGPYTVVIGMLADKDTRACCRLLAPLCARAICCTPPNPRALPAEELAGQLRTAGVASVQVCEDPGAAVRLALRQAPAVPTVVTGSLYLCAQVRPYLLRRFQKNL